MPSETEKGERGHCLIGVPRRGGRGRISFTKRKRRGRGACCELALDVFWTAEEEGKKGGNLPRRMQQRGKEKGEPHTHQKNKCRKKASATLR